MCCFVWKLQKLRNFYTQAADIRTFRLSTDWRTNVTEVNHWVKVANKTANINVQNAVYTLVNRVIKHQKQQISKRRYCSAVHWHRWPRPTTAASRTAVWSHCSGLLHIYAADRIGFGMLAAPRGPSGSLVLSLRGRCLAHGYSSCMRLIWLTTLKSIKSIFTAMPMILISAYSVSLMKQLQLLLCLNATSKMSMTGCQLTGWSLTWSKQNCCGSELNTTCLSWMDPDSLCSSSHPLSTHVNMCACLVFSSRRIRVSTITFPVSAVPASTNFANYDASGVRLTRSLWLHSCTPLWRHASITVMQCSPLHRRQQ